MEDLKDGLTEKGLIEMIKTCLLSGDNPRGKLAEENLKWGLKQYRKHLNLHVVGVTLPTNKEMLSELEKQFYKDYKDFKNSKKFYYKRGFRMCYRWLKNYVKSNGN